MERDEVEKRFKAIVADLFGVDVKKLKDSTRFVEDLHGKSMNLVALIAATESEFKIKTTPKESSENTSIKKTVDYLMKKLK